MKESIEGVSTDGIAIHSKHIVHYWILHKMGYRFCKCGAIKVGQYVWKPDKELN